MRYHFGSLAFGSFIIALVEFIRYVLMYLQKQAEAQKNRAFWTIWEPSCLVKSLGVTQKQDQKTYKISLRSWVTRVARGEQPAKSVEKVFPFTGVLGEVMVVILRITRCCLWCLERFIKFINKRLGTRNWAVSGAKSRFRADFRSTLGLTGSHWHVRNAYIQMAIIGSNFCVSAKKAALRQAIRMPVTSMFSALLGVWNISRSPTWGVKLLRRSLWSSARPSS